MKHYLRLNYYVSSRINLSLEDFHNAGLTPEETKAEIEKLRDPESSGYLYCSPSGFNNNWCVHTMATHPNTITLIVCDIEIKLFDLLKRKAEKVAEIV